MLLIAGGAHTHTHAQRSTRKFGSGEQKRKEREGKEERGKKLLTIVLFSS